MKNLWSTLAKIKIKINILNTFSLWKYLLILNFFKLIQNFVWGIKIRIQIIIQFLCTLKKSQELNIGKLLTNNFWKQPCKFWGTGYLVPSHQLSCFVLFWGLNWLHSGFGTSFVLRDHTWKKIKCVSEIILGLIMCKARIFSAVFYFWPPVCKWKGESQEWCWVFRLYSWLASAIYFHHNVHFHWV